ncbi:MAG TPA: PAS domain-containing protein [Candidatus Didemnitutus sp.]|nr:PAS domain-containing protein [Candidatus Didemnitutus sp.]
MNAPAAISAGQAVTPPTSPAVLVLDANGRVEMASPSACSLWQASSKELVGDSFPNLFTFELTSRAPDWTETQWEVLLAAGAKQLLQLKLQPKEAAAFSVEVRLESAAKDPSRYLAVVTRVVPPTPRTDESPGSLFNTLVERSTLGFFDLNFVKNEVFYSPAWKRMLGHNDASLSNTYETWLGLIHPDDSAAAPDKITARGNSTGGRPFSVEYRMKHARGHYVWVQGVGVQSHGPNGALQRVVGVHIDINDRKEFEDASFRSEERLQLLGERGRVAMFDLDFAADQAWLSPAAKALVGYADHELANETQSFLQLLAPEDTKGGLAAFFLQTEPGQTVFYLPLRLRHRNGADLWVYAGIVRLISRKQELQRVLGFLLPMPESAMQHRTGLSADQLGVLLGELREGVLLVDAERCVLYVNPTAERLLGRTAPEIVGQAAADIFRLVNRQTSEAGESPVDRALTRGEGFQLNNEFFLDLGSERPRVPIAFSCRPVLENEKPTGAVIVFRNPDEMTLSRDELIRANRFESLGQLAGGIAHDFNHLLTTILGGVSLAKDNHDYSYLDRSESACLKAKELSKQLLSFAKGGTSVRKVHKLGDLLAEARNISVAGSAVKVELTSPADLGTVCVDGAQILQVFQNLIINGIQAMTTGQGNIWITASNVTVAEGEVPPLAPANYVCVEVRDNGSGIKPEHLEKIFDPFFTTKKNGTGLGLATVVSIVRHHGGQVAIDSEVGVGTVFHIYLPRAEQEAEVTARRAPSLPDATSTGRVLFMDDDEDIRYLTSTMLQSLGYKYDLVSNGDDAVKLYKRYLNIGRPYDIVIMDLTIVGGMGGEQTFRQLRDLHPDVRAIIASGYDNDDMARQFLDMGFCGYLNKPYRVGDLGRVIKAVLGK